MVMTSWSLSVSPLRELPEAEPGESLGEFSRFGCSSVSAKYVYVKPHALHPVAVSPRLLMATHRQGDDEEIQHSPARVCCGLAIVAETHAENIAVRQRHVEGVRRARVDDEFELG